MKPATFIEPMECLAFSKLPEGAQWVWEIKLDRYRAEAVKSGGDLWLLSRRQKSFSKQFPLIHGAFADLRFFAGVRRGFPVRNLHFNLPQQRHNLLRLLPFHRHTSFPPA